MVFTLCHIPTTKPTHHDGVLLCSTKHTHLMETYSGKMRKKSIFLEKAQVHLLDIDESFTANSTWPHWFESRVTDSRGVGSPSANGIQPYKTQGTLPRMTYFEDLTTFQFGLKSVKLPLLSCFTI